jgi:hypothetical protein
VTDTNMPEPTPLDHAEADAGFPVVIDEKPTAGPVATQVANPWRTTVRSIFQFVIMAATLIPYVEPFIRGELPGSAAAVAAGQALVVYSFVVRLAAVPQVEAFLQRYLPWLAALKVQ